MRAQVGQVPTPQGISALLRKAGFTRSEGNGRRGTSGYRVRKAYSDLGQVRVEYHAWSMGASRETYTAETARYAKVIRDAGWQVHEAEPPLWPKLIIAARPVPSDNSSKENQR